MSQHNNSNVRREGAVLPLFAIMFPVLFILVAFVINIAYLQLSATQLQVSTDAAARAAGRMYQLTDDESVALDFANEAGRANLVAGKPLTFVSDDLEFGTATRDSLDSRYVFSAGGDEMNSVRILGHRTDDSLNGRISTFLPNILGTSNFALSSVAESTQIEVDIALVIDRSGSMAYAADEVAAFPPAPATAPELWDFDQPVPPKSRWLDIVAAVEVFVDELNNSPLNELVSLTTYGDDSVIDVPLTADSALVLNGLDLHSQGLSVGGTNISSGLNSGASSLINGAARQFAAKVIVVMTDGRNNVGSNPADTAAGIGEEGTMIFTVTFSDEADEGLMRRVAEEGAGRHFHANTSTDLISVFQELGRQLPNLLTR